MRCTVRQKRHNRPWGLSRFSSDENGTVPLRPVQPAQSYRQGRQIRQESIPAAAETAPRPWATGNLTGRTPISLRGNRRWLPPGGDGMDPRVRIMAATGVMLAGLLVALAFRHPAGQVEPPAAGAADPLVVRKQAAFGARRWLRPARRAAGRARARRVSRRPANMGPPCSRRWSRPALRRTWPSHTRQTACRPLPAGASRWGR